MNLKMISFYVFLLFVWSFSAQEAKTETCPNSTAYAMLNYDHKLLNQIEGFSQSSRVIGFVGLKIGPSGISNSGNNVLQRMVEMEVDSVCSADGESDVTVTITGSCVKGVLDMRIQEVYPQMTLTGSCGAGLSSLKPSITDFNLKMDYKNDVTKVQPYSGGTGTYSWQLQFINEPPPSENLPLAFLVPIRYLLRENSR